MNLLDLYIDKVASNRIRKRIASLSKLPKTKKVKSVPVPRYIRTNKTKAPTVKTAQNVLNQKTPLSAGMNTAVKSNPLTAASNALNMANKGLLKKPRSFKQEASTVGRTLLGKK